MSRLWLPTIATAVALVVALVVDLAGGFGGLVHAQSLTVSRCETDDEVPAPQRQPYEQAAQRLAQSLTAHDAAAVHALFTAEVRQGITEEKLDADLLQQLDPMVHGIKNLRVVHTYTVSQSGATADRMVVCSTAAHGSATSPVDQVFVAAKPVPKQAHVVLEADNANNIVSFIVWLLPETGEWHVQGLHVVPTTLAGKTAAELRTKALDQGRRSHAFSEMILLSGASELAFRGRYMQLGLWQQIQKDAQTIDPPSELKGKAPFDWALGGASYHVLGVGPMGVGDKMALAIRREVTVLGEPKQAEDDNRAFIRAFLERRPEVRDAFDAIVVRSEEAGSHRGFGTVEEFHKSP